MEGLSFGSCDKFYEEGRSFEEVYEKIVAYVLEEAAERDTVFAVPGSPLVAERTVLLLRAACEARQLPLTILPAISFLDLAYVRLNLDPVNGLRIADASDREAVLAAGRYPLIITQVYSRLVAAELKLNLMEALGDEEEIFFRAISLCRRGMQGHQIIRIGPSEEH
jgi:tetrapyrrole methylase family protein/MazG family protein